MRDKSAFDLFQGLAALGSRDKEWFNALTPEGQKASAPFVIARWLTGTSDQEQILRLNQIANPYLFTAEKGPLFQLLAIACTGRNKRYSWLKGPGQKSKKYSIELVKQYYNCSSREAQRYKIDIVDLLEMAETCGWEPDQIKNLQKELNDPRTPSKPGSKPPKSSPRH